MTSIGSSTAIASILPIVQENQPYHHWVSIEEAKELRSTLEPKSELGRSIKERDV
jgi:hypothetical protein